MGRQDLSKIETPDNGKFRSNDKRDPTKIAKRKLEILQESLEKSLDPKKYLQRKIERAYDKAKFWPPIQWNSLPSREQFDELFARGFKEFQSINKAEGWVKLRNPNGQTVEFMVLFAPNLLKNSLTTEEEENLKRNEWENLVNKFYKKYEAKQLHDLAPKEWETMGTEIMSLVHYFSWNVYGLPKPDISPLMQISGYLWNDAHFQIEGNRSEKEYFFRKLKETSAFRAAPTEFINLIDDIIL